MKKVIAVILTHNRKDMLCRCIEAVKGQKGVSCDILVADSGSTDDTVNLFGTLGRYKDVVYYDLGENRGTGGFSYGVEKAVRLGYEYIWLMDDDVIPDRNALLQLMRAGKCLQNDWGFLASYVYWKDGSLCKANIPKLSPLHFVTVSDKKRLVPVRMASWASILVKSSVVRRVGLPYKDYFVWTDDYEFTARISRRYCSYLVPSSRVLHEKKANIKADIIKESYDRLYRFRYLYRNDVHFYRKYGLQGHVYLLLKFIYTFIQVCLFAREHKAEKLKILIKGYREGGSFNPKIESVKYLGDEVSGRKS